MWREKHIRWSWWLVGCNVFVSVANIFFSYGHWIKQEYWGLGISLILVALNSWVAYTTFKSIKRMREELKDFVWQKLSTPARYL